MYAFCLTLQKNIEDNEFFMQKNEYIIKDECKFVDYCKTRQATKIDFNGGGNSVAKHCIHYISLYYLHCQWFGIIV